MLTESKVQKIENWYGKDGKELSYVYRLTLIDDEYPELLMADFDHDPTDDEIAGAYKNLIASVEPRPKVAAVVEERAVDTVSVQAKVTELSKGGK